MSNRFTASNVQIFILLGAMGCVAACSSTFDGCQHTRSCIAANDGSSGESGDDPSIQSDDPSSSASGAGGLAGNDDDVPTVAGQGAQAGQAGAPPMGQGGEGGSQGGEGGSQGGEGGEPSPGDTTAPTIVSITPELGSLGVEEGAVITVTFDEPMDKVSAEAAFQSAELAGEVTFAWDEAGTVLTVTPTSPLEYAVGDDDVAAKAYTATIATTAVDLAGNALQAEASTTFTTLRRIQRTLETLHLYTVRSNGDVEDQGNSPSCDLWVGDLNDNTHQRAFIRFDLSVLPDDLITLESAELGVFFTAVTGGPFISVTHYYEASYNLASLLAPGFADLGVIADPTHTGLQTLDVTAAVRNDLAYVTAREWSSGYRLGYPLGTDYDSVIDLMRLSCDPEPALELQYTRP